MRISTKGGGIIKAQQGTIARPNPKENYKLPEDQRYQAQTRGMKDFAIEWYKERAKQPKYQSQVNESNLANITDQINRADQAVMDTVKSNMTNNIPFQLLYYGVTNRGGLVQSLPVSLHGVPLANVFTLYVGTNSTALTRFSLNKGSNQKWIASTLSNS